MRSWIAKDHLPFREDYAKRALEFFPRNLVHHLGRWAGKPFELAEFQKGPLAEIFGRVDEHGHRYIRETYWELPKKNGKSPIAGGIVGKLGFADSENAPHIYGAAADREQADVVFTYVEGMIAQSPSLRSRCKVLSGRRIVKIPSAFGFYKILSKVAHTKHGHNTHGLVVDEVHALTNFDLWDRLTFGAGAARDQPLFMGLTTAGVAGQSVVAEEKHKWSEQILRGVVDCPDWFFPVVWSAPKDADWTDRAVWEACNPALGHFLKWSSVEQEFDEAQLNLRKQNDFRRYRLNQWVQQLERWIDLDVWDGCAEPLDLAALKEYPCILGLDLSSKIDLTAVVAVFALPGRRLYAYPFFWVPGATVKDRDSVEAHNYRKWIKAGQMMECPGAEIDYGQVEQFIVDLRNERGLKVREVVYDPFFAGQMAQRLEAKGFTMVEFSQRGYTHWNEPCLELEAALAANRFVPDTNPCFRWNADCVEVRRGPGQTMRPEKPDRNRTTSRIDGIGACLMGIGRAAVWAEKAPSMYANPDTAVM